MTSIVPKFMSLCEDMYETEKEEEEEEAEEEEERSKDYCKGGYLRVKVGDTFYRNRYIVVRKLGWGAFSTVWLCLDIKFNDYVAIKITKSKKCYRESALQEIQLLSDVLTADPKDPFSYRVVNLLNYFTTKGNDGRHQCLVFEVLGDSLFKFMNRSFINGIPIQALKRIIRQILEGLQYLHSKCKVIHTDIKPENILLTINNSKIKEIHSKFDNLIGIWDSTQLPSSRVSMALKEDNLQSIGNNFGFNQNIGNKIIDKKSNIFDEDLSEISIKIVDLGNSCLLDESHSSTIQTRPYRSPEVILGLDFSTSADIWSMACTAFELATGQLLFKPNNSQKNLINDKQLAKMLRLLGPLPLVLRKGKHYTKYFNKRERLLRLKVCPQRSLDNLLVIKYGWTPKDAQSFAQFLLPMLEMDPNKRATAQECLSHQWLNF